MLIEANGHLDFFQHIAVFDDNQFQAAAFAAKSFVELLPLENGNPVDIVLPNTPFQEQVIQGISLFLHNFCYNALADLQGNAELKDNIHGIRQSYQDHLKNEYLARVTTIANVVQGTLQKLKDQGTDSPTIQSPAYKILQCIREAIHRPEPTMRLAEILQTLNISRDRKVAAYDAEEERVEDSTSKNYGDVEDISLKEHVGPSSSRQITHVAFITFFTEETLIRVLDGNKRVKLIINGKNLWAQKYVPKGKNKV
uniref:Uncharacterized protein n=1 Tax=Leersia perrieri TaxID=77586 RepID=A0A0D9WXP4_9ORYZ